MPSPTNKKDCCEVIMSGTLVSPPYRSLEEEVGGVRVLSGISTPVHRLSYIPSLQVAPSHCLQLHVYVAS